MAERALLPSDAGGPVTETVGWFQRDAATLAEWLARSLGRDWTTRAAGWTSLSDAVGDLPQERGPDRRAIVPVESWSALLTDGPLGTDVGVIPSLAARELGCLALRAVAVGDDAPHPARILEVFAPDGIPPLLTRRSIAAADDGGRWVFETSGEPFAFEDLTAYERSRKSDRLPSALLHEYLRALGVPLDIEPQWSEAIVIERSRSRWARLRGRSR